MPENNTDRENNTDLNGKQKAAILLISLGPDRAAQVLQKLSKREIELLTDEIGQWEKVPPELTAKVYKEFYQMSLARKYLAQGGKKYAQDILERALGDHRAMDIIKNLEESSRTNLFNLLENIDPQQLLGFIQSEHPQTIALVLSHLEPNQAAMVLSALPQELQPEIITRIINIGHISPEVIREVENVLRRELSSISKETKFLTVGGTRAAAEILNRVDRSAEKNILETLEKQNVELAEEVKKFMFVFEDILSIDDRSLQRVLREIDTKDLALALKGASRELREKFFKNMSSRAVETIKEDMEFMGPVRVRNVEEAQQKIVNIIRKLEEKGEIVGRGGKEEEIIV
ncbi:flagellar motor switch protein FliG [Candidatus Aerophobetes bacterium]|nr:flagellar motor switch protein FliG [Candidatus Aerophobetes bacterium]